MALHLYLMRMLESGWVERGVQPRLPEVVATGAACAVAGAAAVDAGAGEAGVAGVAGGALPAASCCASHCANSALETAFTTIGMKPWSCPHSSAHWPR